MELIIGPRTYSTWSLRGWLVMKRTGADFTTVDVRYETQAQKAALRQVSPSGFVPVLRHGDTLIWDTLAIAEWAAETYPEARLWPADPMARALARSATAEMSSWGSAAAMGQMRGRFGQTGPWLFGDWSIADAFFTPVAARIRHFQIDLSAHGDDGAAATYVAALLAQPAFRQWETEALA